MLKEELNRRKKDKDDSKAFGLTARYHEQHDWEGCKMIEEFKSSHHRERRENFFLGLRKRTFRERRKRINSYS